MGKISFSKSIKKTKTGGRKIRKTFKKKQHGGSDISSFGGQVDNNTQIQSQSNPSSNMGGRPPLGKSVRNGIINLFGIIKNKISKKLFSKIEQHGGKKRTKTFKKIRSKKNK